MKKIDFPVVGIGASAGGLKVLQDFFEQIDANSGMAFVVITHLAPQKTSAMDELLASHTSMDVEQAKDKTVIQPNHIYIIPPNKQLFLQEDQLMLAEKEKETQAVIDIFLRSMAKECEKLAIGVILSGTGSDGSLGLKSVKEYGGVTMVQDPSEASFDGMPRSAIGTNHVDFIMPVKELAKKITEHKKVLVNIQLPLREEELSQKEASALQKIFTLLTSNKGHDFKHYKRSSVLRRLQRRMYVTNNKNINEYQNYLEKNPAEITELFNDLLISVTNFFRDPEAFEALEKKIIPKLFENKEIDDPVRVWITGCATGEEVYSLAILLQEYASKLDYRPLIKIFGTDISNDALRIARNALYPETIATDITTERLQRYFHKEDLGYRVCQEIREKVLISNHDILSDPPFLNQDLIACRNLLIYFNQELQNEVLKIVHYALKPKGFLFLGMADSTIGATDLFAPVNKGHALYKARQIPRSQKDIPHFPLLPNMHRSRSLGYSKYTNKNELTFDKIHYSLLANQFAPPSVIIDENDEVMHSSQGIDQYLKYAEGEPTRNLLKMVSPRIQRSLRNIIFQLKQSEKPQPISKQVKIQRDDDLQTVNLSIRPIEIAGFPRGFRQITFEKIEEPESKKSQKIPIENPETGDTEIVEQLEEELDQTKEQLQQTIEEYETSNEELMASNEELQSMNEELQTTTEELETSKEELQSVNEELRTVNQELENNIDELKNVHDDLKNLVEATEIGIIFVNKKLEIKLYTHKAAELFNLIDSDLGRPLSHITHKLRYENLQSDVSRILSSLKSSRNQVATLDGKWYIMRIKPYKTIDSKIEGAILTFVDITDLKKAEGELKSRAKNDEALANLGKLILKYTGVQPILDKATKILSDELNADAVAWMKADKEKDQLWLTSATGLETDSKINPASLSLGRNSEVDYVLHTQKPLIVRNFQNDDRFSYSKWLIDQKINSGIITRVKGSKHFYGILGVYFNEDYEFTSHEVVFIQNIATMVGEAIQRIKMETELKEATKILNEKIIIEKKLKNEILEVEKEERWRLGQYLHDGTAQNLIGIKMLLDFIEPNLKQLDEATRTELEKIKQLIIKSETNIRELSHFVLPIEDDGKISNAFHKLINQTKELYDIECDFNWDEKVDEIKNPTSSSSLYYITQEAIRNAISHGKADNIFINLTIEKNFLYLTVKDNGKGLGSEQDKKGMGINIMKHRTELLGGTLELKKAPKTGGTTLTCRFPLDKLY